MNEPEKWIIIGLQPRSRSYYLSAIFSSTHKPTGSHINGFLEFLLPLPIPGKVPLIFILLFVYFNFYFTPVSFDWIFLRKQSPFSRNAHTSHFPLLYFIFFFFNYRGSYDYLGNKWFCLDWIKNRETELLQPSLPYTELRWKIFTSCSGKSPTMPLLWQLVAQLLDRRNVGTAEVTGDWGRLGMITVNQ